MGYNKTMENTEIISLIEQAIEARKNAYTPYSHFAVGAALLGKTGRIYTGCNIENAAYTPTNCAERTAFFKAVSQGEHEFSAIAIVGGRADMTCAQICPPCGVCRQVMREFCRDDFPVYLVGADGSYETVSLAELLPHSFSAASHMGGGNAGQ